jgi:DNA-binding CsgD family transcriptional regulator
MTADAHSAGDGMVDAREALAAGRWAEARRRFEAELANRDFADAWEGLGWSAYWLHDEALTFRARERAYQAYRSDGDPRGAGRIAAWLAADCLEFRGDEAVASGWLERAHRLLDELPRCAEQGWLAVVEGSFRLALGDLVAAGQDAVRGAEIGRRSGIPDLEAIGLALEGYALVGQAQVADGMRRLDEASAIAAGETLQLPISSSWALCYVIAACEGVGDFPRAVQWCAVMRASADRWGARHSRGVCRSSYGTVLTCCGEWEAAEHELAGAVRDLEAARPGMVGGGLVRLGRLRAHQGRVEEARLLFERAGGHRLAVLGLGRLALDAGDPATAADAAERVLRRLPGDHALYRIPALELLAQAHARVGDAAAADAACTALQAAARDIGTGYVGGRALLTVAEVAMAKGAWEDARRACEDALDAFVEVAARYDAALARLGLAQALAALGRPEPAAAEAGAARDVFAALGAVGDAARAEAGLLDGTLGRDDCTLTARELEVLRLVAQGLTDDEIAARLHLSPHTVHRHVANARVKLRLPSRAAAVAHAARVGLL